MPYGWKSDTDALIALAFHDFAFCDHEEFGEVWEGPIPKAGSIEDSAVFYLRSEWGYDSIIDNSKYYIILSR